MGTRGAFGFRINGVDKVTYNHYDSYPEQLGAHILYSISQDTLENLREVAEKIVLVDESKPASKEEVLQCRIWKNLDVGSRTETDWYCLLRGAQGGLEAWLEHGLVFMIDSSNFLADSLFCEYAYIINLDEECLEFYVGFNKNPEALGRYASLGDGKSYRGVVLMDNIPLREIFAEALFENVEEKLSAVVERWKAL